MAKKCALCEKESELLVSHIIPKFVLLWLKKTSATGYLRWAIKPNVRAQDGAKFPLLCKDCETKFSKYENYFARNIFYPYLDKKKDWFVYNKNLQLFIISISWRTIKIGLDELKLCQPNMYKYVVEAEKYWKNILLSEKNDDKYEHHIVFWDYVKNSTLDLPKNFQAYTMRSLDATVAASSEEAFMFFKFPSMMFISSIYPKKLRTWLNTKVENKGMISTPQTVMHPGFHDFLFSRVQIINDNPLSIEQKAKIKETMLKDRKRVLKSKTFELWLKGGTME